MMSSLLKDEICLKGKWMFVDGKIVKDEIDEKINFLINNALKKVAVSNGGWEILYFDDENKGFWELTYPSSEMHGGGPKQLEKISIDQARKKYTFNHHEQ